MSTVEQRALSSRNVRRIVIDQAFRAGVGHIGSALSIVDLLVALYGDPTIHLGPNDDASADRLILSKGHAALALYAVLFLCGSMAEDQLSTYCGDGTLLGVHPERALPGIHFSTGSLGHGLSMGAGTALGGRMQGTADRTFVLMSDAECNEGSVWEAAMFAGHHRLSNLIGIVDLNGQQALGHTRDVLSLDPLAAKWKAFGWDVHELDGHNIEAIRAAIAAQGVGAPRMILASTTFGKGVSYMESSIAWHYQPMTAEQHAVAIDDINR
jgi:transketolase